MQSFRLSEMVYFEWIVCSFLPRRVFSEDVDAFCCIVESLLSMNAEIRDFFSLTHPKGIFSWKFKTWNPKFGFS